jgi:type VI secretion system secreted protein Hcp
MAHPAYMTTKGQKQGVFKGQGPKGENRIPVVFFEFETVSMGDASGGQAPGGTAYKPVVFKREVDAASPQLFLACATNETLLEIVLSFAKVSSSGTEAVYYTVKFTNAVVAWFRQSVQVGEPGGPAVDSRFLDEVSLNYEKVEVTDIPGKTTAAGGATVRV